MTAEIKGITETNDMKRHHDKREEADLFKEDCIKCLQKKIKTESSFSEVNQRLSCRSHWRLED